MLVAVSKMKVAMCSYNAWNKRQWTVLLGYLTISTNVECYYRVVYNNFVFQQDSAPVHLAFNIVQLLQCKTLSFISHELWLHNSPELH